jgi:hypothetical protein
VKKIESAEDIDILSAMLLAFGELAPHLEASDAAETLLRVSNVLTRAISEPTDLKQLERLGESVARSAPCFTDPAAAQPLLIACAREIEKVDHYATRLALVKAVVALAKVLPLGDAGYEAMDQQLVTRVLRASNNRFGMLPLARTTLKRQPPESRAKAVGSLTASIVDPSQTSLLEVLIVDWDENLLRDPLYQREAAAGPLGAPKTYLSVTAESALTSLPDCGATDQQLLDLIKAPTSLRATRCVVMKILESRWSAKLTDCESVVTWVERRRPDLDLKTPVRFVRPESNR